MKVPILPAFLLAIYFLPLLYFRPTRIINMHLKNVASYLDSRAGHGTAKPNFIHSVHYSKWQLVIMQKNVDISEIGGNDHEVSI